MMRKRISVPFGFAIFYTFIAVSMTLLAVLAQAYLFNNPYASAVFITIEAAVAGTYWYELYLNQLYNEKLERKEQAKITLS